MLDKIYGGGDIIGYNYERKVKLDMGKWCIRLRDRQTGTTTSVWIEADGSNDAKAKAIEKYGISYEIL